MVESVISGQAELRASENAYDWLGHGSYFWENDPARALEYARLLKAHPRRGRATITEPAVLGAIIDPGHCLNLMESSALNLLHVTYETFSAYIEAFDNVMPNNIAPARSGADLLLRHLDCAVIEFLHETNTERSFDTVRGLFFEGEDLYPNAGFKTKNHIQICVRNPNCIKGYFLPREQNPHFPLP